MSETNAKDVERKKRQVLTPEFRVSYPNVHKPQTQKEKDGTEKRSYGITMLFSKKTDLSSLKKAIYNAKVAKFGKDEDTWPRCRNPISDGDDEERYGGKEGYKGHWVVRATSSEDQKPGVYGAEAGDDGKVQPISNPGDFYPGCYARAYILAYTWEFMGKKGVSFILDHVQKLRDGKPFSSKKPGEDVFSPVSAGDDAGDDDGEMEDF